MSGMWYTFEKLRSPGQETEKGGIPDEKNDACRPCASNDRDGDRMYAAQCHFVIDEQMRPNAGNLFRAFLRDQSDPFGK